MLNPKYDVLDVRYSDGSPAVLRHVDGTGCAYYASGRRAICVSACGLNALGEARRFSAVVHGDTPKCPLLGVIDEWGRGYLDGLQGPQERQPPKVLLTDQGITLIDGNGVAKEIPGGGGAGATPGAATAPETAFKVAEAIMLRHVLGRTTLDFQSKGVSHTFALGELRCQDVPGLSLRGSASLPENKDLQATKKLLAGVQERVKAIKVETGQKDRKPPFTLDTSNLQEVLDNLATLPQKLHREPMAPVNLEWRTELRLRELLSEAHPQCPGIKDQHNWTIHRVGGRASLERLEKVKPTVQTPKTIPLVKGEKLQELIDDCAAKGTLLVVVCTATWAREQSGHAQLLAEKVHAELLRRMAESQRCPRFAALELTDGGGAVARYNVKEVPHCLMFQGGSLVHSKRMRGTKDLRDVRDAELTRPRALLVEPSPAQQLKLERSVRRAGCSSDLAFDAPHALRLASQQAYGVLFFSAQLAPEQLKSVAAEVRHRTPHAVLLAYNAALRAPESQNPTQRKELLEDCSDTFPFVPSYTSLAAVLARYGPGGAPKEACSPGATAGHAKDFLDEVLGVLDGKSSRLSVA